MSKVNFVTPLKQVMPSLVCIFLVSSFCLNSGCFLKLLHALGHYQAMIPQSIPYSINIYNYNFIAPGIMANQCQFSML